MEAIKERRLSVAVFVFFSAWLISFPYEGQIFYALAERFNIKTGSIMLQVLAVHIAGLLLCGLFVKNIKSVKRLMLFTNAFCIAGSGIFFFPPFGLSWNIALLFISFFAGCWISAWGFYFKLCTPKDGRMGTAAAVLAFSALIMILLNILTVYLSPYLGLGISVFILLTALLLSIKLPANIPSTLAAESLNGYVGIAKPLALLCLFILIITIDSGLMFQVINPKFSHMGRLTIWYWSLPYIIAVYTVNRLPKTINRSYILYTAIAMIGLSFVAFLALAPSVLSYLIINTLLMGACGINDLFWWSILGEMLELGKSPAKILGAGLCANVSGVLLGELIANKIAVPNSGIKPSLIGLAVVFAALIILPLLLKCLLAILKNNAFLTDPNEIPPSEHANTEDSIRQIDELTDREKQIAALLLKGYTYKMIANELFLSENTVKTHIKNIYSKLGVKNKSELIKIFTKTSAN